MNSSLQIRRDAESLIEIACRLAQLPAQKRHAFRQALRRQGIDDADLPIVPQAPADGALLSFAQQRLWFLDQLEGQNAIYNICAALRLSGLLEAGVLKASFEALFKRHAALRTTIETRDGAPRQMIVDGLAIPWQEIDLSGLSSSGRDTEMQRLAAEMAQIKFNLACPPLMRLMLVRLTAEDHVLLLTLHHIVADGWSLEVLVDELGTLYRRQLLGIAEKLPTLPIGYADFACWQRDWLQGETLARHLALWQQHLGNEHPLLALPTDRPRPAQQSYRGKSYHFSLSPELSGALRSLSRRHGKTLFALMLAGFNTLLFRYTGQNDIRVGTPIANRQRPETQGLIGLFANTLALRSLFQDDMCFEQLLSQTGQTLVNAQIHQDLPFEQLVDALQPERELSHAPLFQAMYVQHTPQQPLDLPGLTVSAFDTPRDTAKFDLTLELTETPQALHGAFNYASDLFDATTIARMSRHFECLLQGIVKTPHIPLARLPLLDAAERQQILYGWNATAIDYPQEAWAHELFERQAQAAPSVSALLCAGQSLSYAELNERANRLAHYLRAAGIGPDAVVGVCLERSVDMVVALLAVMKAGGAYLPLDPDYPSERLHYLLTDAQVRLLLTVSGSALQTPVERVRVVTLDSEWPHIAAYSACNPAVRLMPDNLAYVIYTSGSTGKPKGVAVPHRGLLNRLQWMQAQYKLAAQDRVLQKTPFSFDVSVWEFFWPLMTGAGLVVAQPGDHRDSERLVALIRRHQVTTLHFVPSMLRVFLEDAEAPTCRSLTRVICSGEALTFDLQQRFFATLDAALHNLYGPTEASIDVSYWACRRDSSESVVPIGFPLANTALYVLDTALNPAPAGVAGELHIGGVGLARGYLGKAALTAEKFIPDPFGRTPGGRLYKTGDLARFRQDGAIEYLGRLDYQVKIRGFRIELGEIETRLLTHPHIEQAVVIDREDGMGGKRLVAYWVGGAMLDSDSLPRFLHAGLPDYMVPSAFVQLNEMPLSPNGKLDRKALPAPDFTTTAETWAEPCNELEYRLMEVWKEVLGLPKIGIHDNFFRIGGDSILSLQVVAKARQQGIRLTPRQMFEHQTVAAVVSVAELCGHAQTVSSTDDASSGDAPLTPIQYWFFEANFLTPQHWNQAVVLALSEPVSPGILQQALSQLIQHHAGLRLRFERRADGGWRQYYIEQNACGFFEHIDLRDLPVPARAAMIEARGAEAQARFHLQHGPLLRAVLFDCGAEPARLLIAIHHLAVDGVSWRVLLDDLQSACRQGMAGKAITLPPVTASYRQWAQQLQAYAQSGVLRQEIDYWRDTGSVSAWPQCETEQRIGDSCCVRVCLDAARTQSLLNDAPAVLRTRINDILLTALAQTLCAGSAQAAVLIELEGHGREDLFDDIDVSRTVGWFTSRFPVKLVPGGEDALTALKAVKEQLRRIPHNGIGYGLLRYLGDTGARASLAALPRPQVCFNYLGRFDQTFQDQAALFALAPESPGATRDANERRTHALDIDGQVTGDTLTFDWTYSPDLHAANEIESCAHDFIKRLEALIDALLAAKAGATPSDFPLAGLRQQELDVLPLDWRNVADIYPLAPMQHGLLVHTLLNPGTGMYLMQERYCLQGELQPEAFVRAWEKVVERHAVLRTAFVCRNDDAPLQVVHHRVSSPILYHDWRGESEAAQRERLDALLMVELRDGFNLVRPPLVKFRLIRLRDDRYYFTQSYHHILIDAWCFPLLMADFLTHYRALCEGSDAYLPIPRPYANFIGWLGRQDHGAAKAYWRENLRGFTERTPLMIDHAGSEENTVADDCCLLLSKQETAALQASAQRHQLTVNTYAQAAWALLLASYSGRHDVLFGVTVAGRPPEIEGVGAMVGLFINTLPLRLSVQPDEPVLDWLKTVLAKNVDRQQHQYLPLWDVQACSPLGGGESLFDSLFVFENTPVDRSLAPDLLPFRVEREQGGTRTSYPLMLAVTPGDRLRMELCYDGQRFDKADITRMLEHFKSLLLALAANSLQPVGALSLLTAEEHDRQLAWGRGAAPSLQAGLVHQLFEAQAATTPENVALIFDDVQLRYRELNVCANRVAHRLLALGVTPDMPVGLCVERSPAMVIALLAIVKAGGAYVPLDPDLPAERLSYIVQDAGIRILVSQSALAERWQDVGAGRIVCELDAPEDALAAYPAHDLPVALSPSHLAYIIYTSGSTGHPKGVGVSHQALAAHIQVMRDRFALTAADRVLQFSTVSFDACVDQIYPPLIAGAALVLRGADLWDSDELYTRILRHGVTVADFTTAYWAQAVREFARIGARSYGALRQITVGGEALSPEGIAAWRRAGLGQVRLFNAYGPTEATVTATLYDCGAFAEGRSLVPIGQALPGRCIYLLDSGLKLAPAGIPGELCIGGELLARGYHGRPELTAERFVPDPFGAPGARLYRTGDLAQWHEDGVIECLGRIDHQVKIRGFRVELGEIEARLRQHAPIQDVAIVVREVAAGDNRLVAYVVAEGARPDADALRSGLAQTLPDYMIPAAFVFLASLPLNINGKLDRSALPAPEFERNEGEPCVPPRNDIERRLTIIWQDVLNMPQIGIHDNFFKLGGDSILALQAVSRIRQAGLVISPKELFQHQTIERLALVARIEDARVAQHGMAGDVPLTPIQHWFFEQQFVKPAHWNQSVLFYARQFIDTKIFEQALAAVMQHHEALGLRFIQKLDGLWRQTYPGKAEAVAVQVIDLGATSASDTEATLHTAYTRVQASLDLAQGRLVAAAIVTLPDSSQRLLLAIHHLVVDGVSWRILLEDLQMAYGQLMAGQSVSLPPKSASYQAWASHLQACAHAADWRSELEYWQKALRPMAWPIGASQEVLCAGTAQRIDIHLSEQETAQLLLQAPLAYRTQINDLLLSALTLALCRWSGGEHALIELEGHGRESLTGGADKDGPDVSRTVGWFTARFPVCLQPGADLAATVKRVKEQLRQVPDKGIGWGLLEYLADADIRAAVKALPQPRISFNYLGQLDHAQRDGLFGFAKETGGDSVAPANRRSHWIEIDGGIIGNRLSLGWTFSPALHTREDIAQLAEDYLAALRKLIAHCVSAPGGATPSDFSLVGMTQMELDRLPVATLEDIYPLAPMQQGLLFHALFTPESDVYANQLHCILHGSLDINAFRSAWEQAVARHAILRTSFYWKREGEPLQLVWKNAVLPFEVYDWRQLDAGKYANALALLLEQDRKRGFDLTQAPLMRFSVIERYDGAREFVWNCHHVLLDGWSSARLIDEVLSRYFAALDGRAFVPHPLRPYRDYIEWTRRQSIDAAERYWRDALAPLSAPLKLADCVACSQSAGQDYKEQYLALAPELTAALQVLAMRQQVTLNTIVQAAWAILLSRYSGRNDVVFGATVAGRPAELVGADAMLGLFINTLPVYCQIDPAQALGDCLRQLQQYHAGLWQFDATPLAEIQRWHHGSGGNALFDTLVVFENYPIAPSSRQTSAQLSIEVKSRSDRTTYPLTLNVIPGEQLQVELSYQLACFDEAAIIRIAGHFEQLLRQMATVPEPRPGDLVLLTPQEQRQVRDWNATGDGTQAPHDYFTLFTQQTERTPDVIAARCGDQALSYCELWNRADLAGGALMAVGIGPDDVVALYDRRGLDLLVMILGVFKAGAAYLPLDPDHPPQRLADVLRLSGAAAVLSGAHDLTSLIAALDQLGAQAPHHWRLAGLEQCPAGKKRASTKLAGHAAGRCLAYIIYTSGSTGAPKGAMVERRGMLNNLLQKHVQLGLTPADVIAQTASACFDISVWQFLSGLLCGAVIDIVPDDVAHDPQALLRHLDGRGVTILEAVPGLIHALLGECDHALKLRWLLPTGEALPPALARHWLERYPRVPLLNAYGPAECADDVAVEMIDALPPAECVHLPIGRPVANIKLYVVDGALQLLSVNAAGELCIAGIGVGRGYLNDPVRTAAAFVPNPFDSEHGEPMYRTGDLVRQRVDGAIEYLGRLDHQVKLRGYRIEPGEIEARLVTQPGVEQAVVVVREDHPNDRNLVAYVTGNRPDPVQLKAALAESLPEYMVPAIIVTLPALPLNANGKIDRKRLPAPDRRRALSTAYAAPANATEALLENVWAKALNLPRISVHDNFFALGGHSLLAVRVMQQVRQLLGREAPLTLLFKAPTIAALAPALCAGGKEAVSPLLALRGEGRQPPLFCVHPAGGHVASYLPLAEALGPDQPVFGLQSRSLFDPQWQDRSIADMARDYVEAVRHQQPEGAYRLLGWSMGGTIALAMAAELEHQGCTVAWVALLDTVQLSESETAIRSDHAAECLDYFAGLSHGAVPEETRRALQADLAALPPETQLAHVVDWGKTQGYLPQDIDTDEIALRLSARYDSFRLLREHRIEPVEAPIHVWQARDTANECEPAQLDWTPYSSHVHCQMVEGDHLEIVRSPQVTAGLTVLLHS